MRLQTRILSYLWILFAIVGIYQFYYSLQWFWGLIFIGLPWVLMQFRKAVLYDTGWWLAIIPHVLLTIAFSPLALYRIVTGEDIALYMYLDIIALLPFVTVIILLTDRPWSERYLCIVEPSQTAYSTKLKYRIVPALLLVLLIGAGVLYYSGARDGLPAFHGLKPKVLGRNCEFICWQGDGNALYYWKRVNSKENKYVAYKYNPATSKSTPAFIKVGYDMDWMSHAAWSYDGQNYASVIGDYSNPSTHAQLELANVNSGKSRVIYTCPDTMDRIDNINCLANNQFMLSMSRWIGKDDIRHYYLHWFIILDAEGNQLLASDELKNKPSDNAFFNISMDGKTVFFEVVVKGKERYYRYDVGISEKQLIDTPPMNLNVPDVPYWIGSRYGAFRTRYEYIYEKEDDDGRHASFRRVNMRNGKEEYWLKLPPLGGMSSLNERHLSPSLRYFCTVQHFYDDSDTIGEIFPLEPPRLAVYSIPKKQQ